MYGAGRRCAALAFYKCESNNMTKNKVAVLGVVFPKVKRFLGDYFRSLEKQAFKDFDVVIINDGIKDFAKLARGYDLNIIEIRGGRGIAKNRELGINLVKKKGYKYLVFTDADDFFAKNRIKESLRLLKNCDIVVNDLTTVNIKGRIIKKSYISNRINNNAVIDYAFIRDKNIFGFSNTAIRANCIRKKITLDKNLVAVDWYLFSRLLKQGRKAVFTNKTSTFYRLYGGNLIGLESKASDNNPLWWEKVKP